MAKRRLASVPLIFGLLFSNLVCTLGKLKCEDLPIEDCAFSVASTGTRCVLEKYQGKDNSIQYECQSSLVTAGKQEEWIESDECVKACGLERITVGLSTDLLMDYQFAEMFCSSECLNNCPNIIDLYINLAAGEGMYLPQLCKAHRTRRVIADPVKKAMDAEYLRSLLPKLTSGDTIAPGASPSVSLPRGPDYRGYQGSSGDEIAPSSPVAGSDAPPGPSWIHKRPFLSIPSPTPPASTAQSVPGAAGVAGPPESGASPSPPAAIAQSIPGAAGVAGPPESGASPSELAPAPSWPQELSVNSFPADTQQMNDEENYLYETIFI